MTEVIRILYRDEALVCCIKEPGLLSEDPGLPSVIGQQLCIQDIFCVHRLDREAAGVMVYALTRTAAAAMSVSFSPQGDAEKTYLAVISGSMEAGDGVRTDLLFHDSRKNRSYTVDRMRKGVREASLSYSVLAERNDRTLVSVRLHSGRTHQIRVQFSSRKHPLLGDRRYGSSINCPLALWSYSLAFDHPVTGQRLSFSYPPPDSFPWKDFGEVISRLSQNERTY